MLEKVVERYISALIKAQVIKYGSSNPPTSGGANTAPWNYESGYTSQKFKTVPDANFYTYFVMTQFDN